MDFDLEAELRKLINQGKVQKSIELAESKLRSLEKTDFHKVLGRSLLHQAEFLSEYMQFFYDAAIGFYKNEHKGFFRSIFKKKANSLRNLKSAYVEMNAFTINPDRWFLDFFAYSQIGSREDFDWLADFDYVGESSFTIEGFEDLQQVYSEYVKGKNWEIEQQQKASNVCELIIVLRLQELFLSISEKATAQNRSWSTLPIFVTAHDYEMILELPK